MKYIDFYAIISLTTNTIKEIHNMSRRITEQLTIDLELLLSRYNAENHFVKSEVLDHQIDQTIAFYEDQIASIDSILSGLYNVKELRKSM